MLNRHGLTLFILYAVLFCQAGKVHALYENLRATPTEIAMLPPHCQEKKILHYCSALIKLMRAESAGNNPRERRNVALDAAGAIKYSLGYIYKDPGLSSRMRWLLPEMHLNMGRAYLAAEHYGEALMEARKALELRSDYEQAYLLLIEIYKRLKKRDGALQAASDGLIRVPDSQRLKREYLELGGKEPFPAPQVQSSAEPKEVSAGEAASSEPPGETPAAASMPPTADAVASQSVSEESAVTEEGGAAGLSCRFCPPGAAPQSVSTDSAVTQEESKPKNNPWCRFCP